MRIEILRVRCRPLGMGVVAFLLSLAVARGDSTLSQWEVDQPIDRSYEMQSPEENLTGSAEPGLSERAIPLIPPAEAGDFSLPLFS